MPPTSPTFRFGCFSLSTAKRTLVDDNNEEVRLENREFDILVFLIENRARILSKDELMTHVWADTVVEENSVEKAIAGIRKALNDKAFDPKFIKTVSRKGYIFIHDIEEIDDDAPQGTADPSSALSIPQATQGPFKVQRKKRSRAHVVLAIILGIFVFGIAGGLYLYSSSKSSDDEKEIRRVVKESQIYESLYIYENPSNFKESDLDKYWSGEVDGDPKYDRKHIRLGVKNLLDTGTYYGKETRCVKFEIQSVELDLNRKNAIVKTFEEWFISVYKSDTDKFVTTYSVGPYFVSYALKKIDGRWLVVRSSTARANAVTPEITNIEPIGEIEGDSQFYVRITGKDFVPSTIFVKIIGPGCPEQNPCRVPNSVLRYDKDLSETIFSAPLTLAPGNYTIYVQNGESNPSNSVKLFVPAGSGSS